MLNSIKKLGLIAALGAWACGAGAFSMVGPFDTWQVGSLNYGATSSYGFDIGGPQNLGQQFRWNSPRLYYAYDASFVSYFGAAGVKAIEQAIAVFNALPPVSQMTPNLTEYPLDSRKINYSAAALGVLDLKSTAMTEIIAQLGIWNPTRFTWALRARHLPSGASCPAYQYTIIMRNFDPITWNPSAYVNNVLYTYQIFDPCLPTDYSDAYEALVDSSAIGGSAVADEISALGANPGSYYTGLTRDDVGGLRYLLSKHQVVAESLSGGATIGGTTGLPVTSGGTQNGSPWNLAVPLVSLTNATLSGNNGSPWTIVSFGSSTNVTTNTTTTTTTTNSTVFNVAGVEKITFVQVLYDSTVGVTYSGFADNYSLTMYKNGKAFSQTVGRAVNSPDLLFSAGDLLLAADNLTPILIDRGGTYLRTAGVTANGVANNGPGIINPAMGVSFSSIGPYYETFGGGGAGNFTPVLFTAWGSYDGTTNAPIVYPDGTSVQQLEQQLFP